MKKIVKYLLVLILFFGCSSAHKLNKYGLHYQKHNDYKSLNKVVELIPLGADSAYVRKVLGEPIDFGFDFRYLLDSIGTNGCVIGAVFHFDEEGRVDQKWLDEICE